MAKKIAVQYRHKGEMQVWSPGGVTLLIIDEDGYSIVPMDDELLGDFLDLTKVPVIRIRGRAAYEQVRSFLKKGSFEGAFLLTDTDEVILTDLEILKGKRLSGGRPEEQWINHRFARDGRYVADYAQVLHGKTLKVIREAVEQDVDPTSLAHALCWRFFEEVKLGDQIKKLLNDCEISQARSHYHRETGVLWDVRLACIEVVSKKLELAGVRRVGQIPAHLTIEALEVLPAGVWDRRESLGRVFIPGIGQVELAQRFTDRYGKSYTKVSLTQQEVRQITHWPFSDILLHVQGVCPDGQPLGTSNGIVDTAHPTLREEYAGRWPEILEAIKVKHVEQQRLRDYPKGQKWLDLRKEDYVLPSPVQWGTTFDGDVLMAYPVLSVFYWRRVCSWQLEWLDSAEKAEEINSKYRAILLSYQKVRHLEAALAREDIREIDVLRNFGGQCRRIAGATSQADHWVVCPDGSVRWPDYGEPGNGFGPEPYKVWTIVGPEELAISWKAAPHEFEVVHLPTEGITEAQLERIREIEEGLEEEWGGQVGMSDKTTSPSVGKGWGLGFNSEPIDEPNTAMAEAMRRAGLL